MKNHRKITVDVTVRFRDIDAMGHVNNAVPFTYFEEGRKAFLREVLDISRAADYPFILARNTCDYLRPIPLDAGITLDIWIADIGTKSFTFRYEVRGGDGGSAAYARGDSVMVWYDYASGKTVPIPDGIASKLREFCE